MSSPMATTFLDLPLEIRTNIYDGYFSIPRPNDYLALELERDDLPTYTHDRHIYWSITRIDMNPPLLLVSQQIRAEALPRFPIELQVVRDLPIECDQIARRPGVPRRLKSVYGRWMGMDLNDLNLPPAAFRDDFRYLYSQRVRQSIVTLRLYSIIGFDFRHINKTQFPKLQLVAFDGLISDAEIFTNEKDFFIPSLDTYVYYDLIEGESPWDVRAGKSDEKLLLLAKRWADWCTTTEVPPRRNRGFRMHVTARVGISKARKENGVIQRTAMADMVSMGPLF